MSSVLARDRHLLPALFLVALATVMFEVLLTRIFSLTLWYHFAFMAISLAMLGLTVGALLVFLHPAWWPEPTLPRAMGVCALLLAICMAGAIFAHITAYMPLPTIALLPMVLTFLAVTVPFVFSGIFVCLALTRFPSRIGKLYAADLAGAATGCLAVIAALRWLDGVGAVLACASLAAAAAICLLCGLRKAVAVGVTLALAGTALWTGVYLARNDIAAFKIQHIKGREDSFSRIAVRRARRHAAHRLRRRGLQVLAALTAVLVLAGLVTGPLVASFGAVETPLRIAASAVLLAAMGLVLGTAFPMGMRLATGSRPELAPWLWGVNGATSVLASVLAVVIAMVFGISASFWTGVASYFVAFAAFALATRPAAPSPFIPTRLA